VLFGTPELFRALWPKIIKACVVAMGGFEAEARFSHVEAQRFLSALGLLRYAVEPGVDPGSERSAEPNGFTVHALVEDGIVCHQGAMLHGSKKGR
jgi:hypothetical protein